MNIESLILTTSQGVPEPVAPFSHVTTANGWAYLTGQLPIDPTTGEVQLGSVVEQTHQVMANLCAVLEGCGYSLDDVVMTRAFLADMADYELFNTSYNRWFEGRRLPSRTCVAVSGLALGALVEIDLTAFKGDQTS